MKNNLFNRDNLFFIGSCAIVSCKREVEFSFIYGGNDHCVIFGYCRRHVFNYLNGLSTVKQKYERDQWSILSKEEFHILCLHES